MVEKSLKGFIYIGETQKKTTIENYVKENNVKKLIIIGDDIETDLNIAKETIKFSDTIMYKYFYRLLQEINSNYLIVLNECLRKQDRYCLEYNCIKRYLLQTPHRLIFNYFPIIKEQKDFMILYDMIQDNPFWKEQYKYVIKFYNIIINQATFEIHKNEYEVNPQIKKQYEIEKEKIISQVRKDPNIIPRRLLKFAEKQHAQRYINFDSMNKIKPKMNVVVSDLKVDKYYYSELINFRKELENALQRISNN